MINNVNIKQCTVQHIKILNYCLEVYCYIIHYIN
jgi:hypothetical protein